MASATPPPATTKGFSSIQTLERYFTAQITAAESKLATFPSQPPGTSTSISPFHTQQNNIQHIEILRKTEKNGFKLWETTKHLSSQQNRNFAANKRIANLEFRNERKCILALEIKNLKEMKMREVEILGGAQAGDLRSFEDICLYYEARIESVVAQRKSLEGYFRGKWGLTSASHWMELLGEEKDFRVRMRLEMDLGRVKRWGWEGIVSGVV
jgi:hypothetical protein